MGKGLTAGGLLAIQIGEETSLSELINRHGARFIVNPERFLDPEATEDLDIGLFTNRFRHNSDKMHGLYDVTKSVDSAIREKSGDCEDYSVVAASWLIQNTDRRPQIILYVVKGGLYAHVNVYDGERIYDYNGMHSTKPENYQERLEVVYKNQL